MPTTTNGLRYPAGSDAANVALYFQNLANDVDGMVNEAWSTYTPVWRAEGAGTQPSIGNGTLSGRYRRLDRYTAVVKVYLAWGSTTSNGTGTSANGYSFSLPAGMTSGPIASVVDGWYVTPTDTGPVVGLVDAGLTKIYTIRAANNNAVVAPGLLTAAGNSLVLHGVVELA